MIQIDFAENYEMVHQDEIQSAHWSHKQVTIFTCCIWLAGETKSVAIVSNETAHSKQTVWKFMKEIFAYIKDISATNPKTKLYIFSDNCAAQFKNKFIMSSLYELQEYAGATVEFGIFLPHHMVKVRLMVLVGLLKERFG